MPSSKARTYERSERKKEREQLSPAARAREAMRRLSDQIPSEVNCPRKGLHSGAIAVMQCHALWSNSPARCEAHYCDVHQRAMPEISRIQSMLLSVDGKGTGTPNRRVQTPVYIRLDEELVE